MFSQESKSRAMENFRRFCIIPRAWVEKQIFQNFRPNLPAMPKKKWRKFDENQPIPPPARVAVANKKGRCFFVANEWREKPRFHSLEVMISSSDEVWQAPTTSDHALGFLSGFMLGAHPKTNMEPKNWVVLNVFPISKGAFSGSILFFLGVYTIKATYESQNIKTFAMWTSWSRVDLATNKKWSLPNQRFATFTFRWRFLHWTDFCYELHSLKVSPWKWAETQLERIDFQPGSFRCELWEPQRGEKDCFSAAIFSEKIWFCNLTILFFCWLKVWPSQVSRGVWRIASQCGAAKGW